MDTVFKAGVPVDICGRCRGLWLDRGELERLSPTFMNANVHATLQTFLRWRRALKCPSCGGHVLPWSYADENARVEIGRCQSCKGLWLDSRLLRQFQKKIYAGEQAALKAAQKESAWPSLEGPNTVKEFVAWITGYPIDFDNPCTVFPFATWTIIGLNIVVYAIQSLLIADPQAFVLRWGLVPDAVFDGQVYRFVTSLFLHADFFHLAGNLLFLHAFADNLEERFGPSRFALLYVGSGALAGLFSCLAFGGSSVPRIGASGAISGIMAAYLVTFPQKHLLMGLWVLLGAVPGPIRFIAVRTPAVLRISVVAFMLLWCGLNIVGWIMQLHLQVIVVDSAAHLGGFLAGLGGGYLLRRLQRRTASPIPAAESL